MILALTEGENNAVIAPKKVLRIIYIFPTSIIYITIFDYTHFEDCDALGQPLGWPRTIVIDGKQPATYSENPNQPIE
jgi:hypothetical protein